MDGQLVVGGHFWEVADQSGEQCGPGRSKPTLDPNDVCQTRKGLAAYTFDGVLDSDWDPMLAGKYNLAWALYPENTLQGSRLHVGGEFLTVSGLKQTNYARLFDAQPPPTCTIVGTSSTEILTGTSADDVICAGGGNDILRGEGGTDQLRGGLGDDHLEGGLGTDTANYTSSLEPISASLAEGTSTGEGLDGFSGIETIIGSSQPDTLTGSEANDTLNGAGGATA